MAQSLSKILLHVVFSTKNRTNSIPHEKQKSLHAYIAEVCRNKGSDAFRVGGTSNHIHIACTLRRTVTVADLLRTVKHSSSLWLNKSEKQFHWQDGYGVFSVSPAHLPPLITYIENQTEHHREITFKDELIGLCMKYGVDYDEAYLWN